jgi:glycerol-3-phosphate acyltransferase PlsY
MNIIYNIAIGLGSLIIGYLIGSFPTAIVIGKVFFKQDPREFGSKNAGGQTLAACGERKPV